MRAPVLSSSRIENPAPDPLTEHSLSSRGPNDRMQTKTLNIRHLIM